MQFTSVNVEARKNLNMRAGDTVKVYQKITEKGKTRLQVFEGLVLSRKHGTEEGATFTVRRVANGFGVEKIYPLYSPMIDKIEVVKRSKLGQSKLYHIRKTALKQISKRMKMMFVNFGTSAEEAKLEAAKPVEPEVVEEAVAEEISTETPAEEKTEEAPATETPAVETEENK
jgi:large subunit ribosomal protein L19